jgi:hypothetical protein
MPARAATTPRRRRDGPPGTRSASSRSSSALPARRCIARSIERAGARPPRRTGPPRPDHASQRHSSGSHPVFVAAVSPRHRAVPPGAALSGAASPGGKTVPRGTDERAGARVSSYRVSCVGRRDPVPVCGSSRPTSARRRATGRHGPRGPRDVRRATCHRARWRRRGADRRSRHRSA